MVKKIAATFIILTLLCTPVLADHWNQNASLIPRTYLLVYMVQAQTEQIHSMYEYFEMMGIERQTDFTWIGSSMLFDIGPIFTTEKLVEYLNTDPVTTHDPPPILFRLVDDVWLTIPMPCKWLRGDATM